MRLLPALLLLCLPGCLSLTGPSYVMGTTGGSLSVQCHYEEMYKGYNKYWCRGQYDTACNIIVETKGEEREERNGRVSIRDCADKLTFTVTMENLNADDAGTYWCRIQTVWILDAWSYDPSVQVKVFVFPASSTTTGRTTRPAAPATLPVVNTRQNVSTGEVLTHSSGSPLSNIHFLLLVFLKLPLFLSMLAAVLWVNRPQRGPGGRQSQPAQGNLPGSAPSLGTLCPAI
ncbi:CMRF35-like molecule 2 [Equus caballus]|uniref:CD300e molecule n=1 Tax=Equus caballus TaxID=9796 RepID=A0A9L0RE85_HORSE|nr:PREDICTED: CMRF35-like molecule 2 isoform X1 [Equus przewalskii]XP_008511426.1 PREDICTED: CMRF35-like molecule 2 isoform X1 [Equus przewalskii]XP_014594398.1 CMRF35-like molecule 2 isoform X3 [Equus caballus]